MTDDTAGEIDKTKQPTKVIVSNIHNNRQDKHSSGENNTLCMFFLHFVNICGIHLKHQTVYYDNVKN